MLRKSKVKDIPIGFIPGKFSQPLNNSTLITVPLITLNNKTRETEREMQTEITEIIPKNALLFTISDINAATIGAVNSIVNNSLIIIIPILIRTY
ncbi:MAG: hypothetical protein QXK56_04325 [Sulfolobales archaeon]